MKIFLFILLFLPVSVFSENAVNFKTGETLEKFEEKVLKETKLKFLNRIPESGFIGQYFYHQYKYNDILICISIRTIDRVVEKINIGFNKKLKEENYYYFKSINFFSLDSIERGKFFVKLSDAEKHDKNAKVIFSESLKTNKTNLPLNNAEIDSLIKSKTIVQAKSYLNNLLEEKIKNDTFGNNYSIGCTYLNQNTILICDIYEIVTDNCLQFLPSDEICTKLYSFVNVE